MNGTSEADIRNIGDDTDRRIKWMLEYMSKLV